MNWLEFRQLLPHITPTQAAMAKWSYNSDTDGADEQLNDFGELRSILI